MTERCRIDGRGIACVQAGDSDSGVLLVHGITTSSFIRDQVIAHLECDRLLVGVDLLAELLIDHLRANACD